MSVFDVTKSTLSYSWAVSMLGIQETVGLLSNPAGGTRVKAPPSSEQAGSALDPEDRLKDLFKAAYEAGDQVQKSFLDSMAHYMTPAALYDPSTAFRVGTEMLWEVSDSFRFFWPDSKTLVAWRELANKVAVYQLVRAVENKLKLPREGDFNLSEYVEKAYDLGPFAALWAVEGLGHDYADSIRERGDGPSGILQGKSIKGIPPKSLLMLHAGIGLSFAQRLFEPFSGKTPETEIEETLARFIGLCRDNSEPGYAGAALESLGLVTRTFHSELVPVVDRYLSEQDEEALGYFWHGVGRAIYFLLVNFLPYKNPIWRAIEMGREEAPHEIAGANTLAGTAWALTLVNMRHPEVMASFLDEQGEDLWDSKPFFTNGVASSMVMRFDTSPDDEFIESFRGHEPAASNRRLQEMWEELVKTPVDNAIDRYHSALRKSKKLDQVFRYQSIEDLLGSSKPKRSGQK